MFAGQAEQQDGEVEEMPFVCLALLDAMHVSGSSPAAYSPTQKTANQTMILQTLVHQILPHFQLSLHLDLLLHVTNTGRASGKKEFRQ